MKNHPEFGETQNGQSRANPEDVAWLAGIIDGEGSFSVAHGGKNGKSQHPRFYIGNTCMALMLKCQRILEQLCGQRKKIRPRDQKTANIVFTIEIAKKSSVKAVIEAIYPHLTVKKGQAEEILAFYASRAQKAKLAPYDEYEKGLKERMQMRRLETFTLLQGGVETKRVAPANTG